MLTWTRKTYWKALGPDGAYVSKSTGSVNFTTPEELYEAIASDPNIGVFTVEPARYEVSKAYGTLNPSTGDVSAPSVPGNVAASPLSASSLSVSWDASTDNVGVSGYQVYINGAPNGSTTENTSATVTGLIPSTQYSVQVAAFDAAGNNSGPSSVVLATTNANTAPSWSTSTQSLTIGVGYSLALTSICSDVDGHTLSFTQVSGTLPTGLTFSSGVVSGTPTTAQSPSVTFRANDGYTTTDQAITFTVTQQDTTAPAVPTGLAAGTPTTTSIPLTWNTNAEGDLASYRLYRSLDGTNYGLRATIAAGTTSYTDTGLNAGTPHYYKLSSVDNATPTANESAQSAAVSATTAGVNPDFIASLPNPITFPLGELSEFEFYPTYINLANSAILLESGTLPTRVTIDNTAAPKLVCDATTGGEETTLADIGFRVLPSAEADWTSRSAASGVFYSHNFTYKDAAKTQLITSDADLHASVLPGLINKVRLHWDTSNKLSGGGSAKLDILGYPAASRPNDTGFGIDFSGLGPGVSGTAPKTRVKHEFYVQFAYYMDAGHHAFYYGDADLPGGFGGKIAIIECADSSFDPGEVVIRRCPVQNGFVEGYRYTVSETRAFLLQTPAGAPYNQDGPLNNFVDLGLPTVSSINTMQQRHGLNYNYSRASGSQPSVDADLANAPRILANTWYTFEVYVKQVASGTASIVKVWFAKYGESPQLLMGSMVANLPLIGANDGSGGNPGQLYTGAQFTNYPNLDSEAPNAPEWDVNDFWPTSDTYVSYAELIASDNPIPFPGGYTLPYIGTEVPSDYPFNLWTEF